MRLNERRIIVVLAMLIGGGLLVSWQTQRLPLTQQRLPTQISFQPTASIYAGNSELVTSMVASATSDLTTMALLPTTDTSNILDMDTPALSLPGNTNHLPNAILRPNPDGSVVVGLPLVPPSLDGNTDLRSGIPLQPVGITSASPAKLPIATTADLITSQPVESGYALPDLKNQVPHQAILHYDTAHTRADIDTYLAGLPLPKGSVDILYDFSDLRAVAIRLPDTQTLTDLPPASGLMIEPNFYVQAADMPPSNDPLVVDQWNLAVMNIPAAWEMLSTSPLVATVAVLDSGVCFDHPDLDKQFLAGWDYVEQDDMPVDENGHGCEVTGIIAAHINNGVGIAGVAPNVQVLPLRVLDKQGYGTYVDVTAALTQITHHAVAQPERPIIANMSFGGLNDSELLKNAIKQASQAGIVLVAAAGNTGDTTLVYPATYNSVIAVGSVNRSGELSFFTTHSYTTLAPGEDILTTTLDGQYQFVRGTSFAAPHISGMIALKTALGESFVANGQVEVFSAITTLPETPSIQPVPTAVTEYPPQYAPLLDRIRTRKSLDVLVGVRAGDNTNEAAALTTITIQQAQDFLLSSLEDTEFVLASRYKYIPTLLLKVNEATLLRLMQAPDVSYIVEDTPMQLLLGESTTQVGAVAARTSGYTGHGQVVVLIDGPMDTQHPFFRGRVVNEACFAGYEGLDANQHETCAGVGTYAQTGLGATNFSECFFLGSAEACYHATHIAGIIAGNDDANGDSSALYGIAPDAELIAVNVARSSFDIDQCAALGSAVPCLIPHRSDQLHALEWIYDIRNAYSIAAVNMSLGELFNTSACDLINDDYTVLINKLWEANIPVVAASGNDAHRTAMAYPACISSVVSVSSVDKQDNIAVSANISASTDLLAPGESILSAITRFGGQTDYAVLSGTSMAAPHVAGALAVLKGARPTASVTTLVNLLKITGKPVLDQRGDAQITLPIPRLQLDAALDALFADTGTLNGVIWLDSNANGSRDVGETGVSAVQVLLLDAGSNQILQNTLTDSFGHYQFIQLQLGNYFVKVIHVDETVLFSPSNATAETLDSDVARDTRQSGIISLVAGGITQIDAGMFQTTLTITRADDPMPNYCLPGDCSLREAIMTANEIHRPDIIDIPDGFYALTQTPPEGYTNTALEVFRGDVPPEESSLKQFSSPSTFVATSTDAGASIYGGDLDITDPLILRGSNPQNVIIDAQAQDRVFQIEGQIAVSFERLTLQHGQGQIDPECLVNGITGPCGGGILVNNATLSLSDVRLIDNDGIQRGGSLFNQNSRVLIYQSEIIGNRAAITGSAIYNLGHVTVVNTTISDNLSNSGSALYNIDTPPVLSGAFRLINVTIYNNQPRGIRHGGVTNTAEITGSILVGNGDNCSGLGTTVSLGYNLVDDTTCPLFQQNDFLNTPARLIPSPTLLVNGTFGYALMPGSLALDTGNPIVCRDNLVNNEDQGGVSRDGANAPCDRGAVEATRGQLTIVAAQNAPDFQPIQMLGSSGTTSFVLSPNQRHLLPDLRVAEYQLVISKVTDWTITGITCSTPNGPLVTPFAESPLENTVVVIVPIHSGTQVTCSIVNEYIAPNQAPTLISPGNQTSVTGAAVSLLLSASDPEGLPLRFVASSLPEGLSINEVTGVISGVIAIPAPSIGDVLLRVIDAGGLEATTQFTWTIQPKPNANCSAILPRMHLSIAHTDVSDDLAIVPERNGNTVTIYIENTSRNCLYNVGVAAYKMYAPQKKPSGGYNPIDLWLKPQTLFDFTTFTNDAEPVTDGIKPAAGAAIGYGVHPLVITIPECATQIDVFYDLSHYTLNAPRKQRDQAAFDRVPLVIPQFFRTDLYFAEGYAERLMGWAFFNQNLPCPAETNIPASQAIVPQSVVPPDQSAQDALIVPVTPTEAVASVETVSTEAASETTPLADVSVTPTPEASMEPSLGSSVEATVSEAPAGLETPSPEGVTNSAEVTETTQP